jgi:hypothetical protein
MLTHEGGIPTPMMDVNGEQMPLIIYEARNIYDDRGRFVEFWKTLYDLEQKDDEFYKQNVHQPLSEERIMEWFNWKNGMKRMSQKKLRSVQRNFIDRRAELDTIPRDASAKDLLDRFADGGVIWRIFWIHRWQPERFPILDQHVYRAMRFIQGAVIEEIPNADRRKIETYINDYLPFYVGFGGLDLRSVDKALWAFGKFLYDNRGFVQLAHSLPPS